VDFYCFTDFAASCTAFLAHICIAIHGTILLVTALAPALGFGKNVTMQECKDMGVVGLPP